MAIGNRQITEKYWADEGPAKIEVTYVDDTTNAKQQLLLGGFITIDPSGGIQNSDLVAAQNAFTEVLTMLRDKYPYVAP